MKVFKLRAAGDHQKVNNPSLNRPLTTEYAAKLISRYKKYVLAPISASYKKTDQYGTKLDFDKLDEVTVSFTVDLRAFGFDNYKAILDEEDLAAIKSGFDQVEAQDPFYSAYLISFMYYALKGAFPKIIKNSCRITDVK